MGRARSGYYLSFPTRIHGGCYPGAGQSKGYCYVNYTSQAAAAAAMETLNGLEFPPHCGQRMKVRDKTSGQGFMPYGL